MRYLVTTLGSSFRGEPLSQQRPLDSIGYFYINGFEDISASLSQPAKLKRELNYIGQDFYNSSEYLAVATFDGIKIFNGALRPAEVLSDYTADGIKISYLLKWISNKNI